MSKDKGRLTIVKNSKYLLIVSIILFGILIMTMQLLPVKTRIKYLGFQPMVILIDSMTGELEQGDFIVLKRAKINQLKVGDIISFNIDLNNDGIDEIVTHYLASIKKNGDHYSIQTKPNVSERFDAWELDENDIIGELWFYVPKIGRVVANPNLQIGTGLAVSIISFTLAIYIATSKLEDEEDI